MVFGESDTMDKIKKLTIRKHSLYKIIVCICICVVILMMFISINSDSDSGKEEMNIVETQETEGTENIIDTQNIEESQDSETITLIVPSKEQVLEAREQVLEGMTEQEIKRLKENIKVANQQMEEAYVYHNIFEKLEDKEHLYWNYFEQKGEIQIGWNADGTPITTYNRFDAVNFINLMYEMKDSVKNLALQNDLQYIIDETQKALETHEVVHVNNIYKMLHDMDYYLLRYGLDDVGVFVQDKSIISKYYGMLSVYSSLKEGSNK